MELINYVLSVVIVFLGPFVGAVLAFISPEELKPGRKYFLWLKWIMFLLALAVVSVFGSYEKLWLVVLAVLLIAMFFSRKKEIISYIVLAVVFYLSSIKQEIFLIVGSMIFIYGLPAGTLLAEKNVKKKAQVMWNIFIRYVWFAVVSLALYLIQFFRT